MEFIIHEVAEQLRAIISRVEPELSRWSDSEVERKPAPEEWSKKEILGHLIDSAANNHQRFVRAVYSEAGQFPTYNQTEWVRIQRCNERPWVSLVALWAAYNEHLCHVIECIPEDAASSPCHIGEEKPARLDFVVKDYFVHLLLHLKDILGEEL